MTQEGLGDPNAAELVRLCQHLLAAEKAFGPALTGLLGSVQKYCADTGRDWFDYVQDLQRAMEANDAGLLDEWLPE